jgi:hypothetical protein
MLACHLQQCCADCKLTIVLLGLLLLLLLLLPSCLLQPVPAGFTAWAKQKVQEGLMTFADKQ